MREGTKKVMAAPARFTRGGLCYAKIYPWSKIDD